MSHHFSLQSFRKSLLDVILLAWLLMTAGGVFMTFTHRSTFFLPSVAAFSYGMLAPYQRSSDTNAEPVAVAFDAEGVSTLLSLGQYFPGARGEKNSRMRLEKMSQDLTSMARQYEPLLVQILQHERAAGHPYDRLDLYWEQWPRSPLGYEALRTQSTRYFITSVQ